jgi:iron complex transport system ATP-binding protein
MTPAPLALHDVTVAHGAHLALRALSLELLAGQCWAVLGPNGAGKSTLARTALGLAAPRSGAVLLGGQRLASLPAAERARALAWLPQLTPTLEGWTVLEVVLAGGAVASGAPWAPPGRREVQRAVEALDELEAGALASRDFAALSGGEQRRVLLARALSRPVSVLVLDEPLASIDVRHQEAVLAAIRARTASGAGVLLSLHEVSVAEVVATHAVLLRQGETVAQGPAAEVLQEGPLAEAFSVPFSRNQALQPAWLKRP